MAKNDEPTELEEQLADALAQVESLQAAAADAEARAATVQGELQAAQEEGSAAKLQMLELAVDRDAVATDLEQARLELTDARSQLREAAVRYREAKLAAAPDVPHDLVPRLETLADIDREFEAAQRVVAQLREKMAEESARESRNARVPAGAPARRAQDLSSLSTSEKIRLGLQQLSGR